MRQLILPVLAVFAGCHACYEGGPREAPPMIGAAPAPAVPTIVPCSALDVHPSEPLDLPALWKLALTNNPVLREAAADVEAARGQWIQAGKYPNPRFLYRESVLGTTQDPAGDLSLEATQEIVTAGKRRLDMAIAKGGTDVASMALVGRTFDVLTRIRRGYHEYLGWAYTLQVSNEAVAALEEGVKMTRKLVEEAKLRPRTDLVRLGAVLEEARLTQGRARIGLETSWRQLAAEVGMPELPCRPPPSLPNGQAPVWETDAVIHRVLAVHSDLKQAALESQRARLEVDRARAEAIPNITIGGGYSANYPEGQHGGTIAIETALPVWDRKQGRLHEAQAHLARAQAAEQSAAARLARDTAEAFGRYLAARQRWDRLTADILPRLVESLDLVSRAYQTGAAQTTFADVLLAEQNLNDARLRLAEARRDLGRAVADLQGLMQLDVGEELGELAAPGPG